VVGEKKIRFADKRLNSYITDGFVRVDETINKNPQSTVKNGQTVSIVIKILDIKHVQKPPPAEFDLKFEDILFEDKNIIVVQKPIGVPTHPTLDPDRDSLLAGLKRYLLVRDGTLGYLGLHHRLDKDTSGLLLLSKKQSVNRHLAELFAERKIEKTYVAVTFAGKKPPTWSVKNHLARSTEDKKKMVSVRSGGDLAITDFKILKQKDKFMMVQAQPRTGRTHQIRVHLSEDGLPILGDPIYFSKGSEKFDRLYLHAWKLKFPHPITKKEMVVESKIPKEFNKFF
jgi:RluA family pseudouridine synthase